MSLDVYLYDECECPTCGLPSANIEIYHGNITHNMGYMARKVGMFFYQALWRPEIMSETMTAKDIIGFLEKGLEKLNKNDEEFKKYNPENGWGSYEDLVEFTEKYLSALKKNPEAKIEVCR